MSSSHWDYYKCKGANIEENSVLLELYIDESESLIMDYYSWTDFMYFLEEGNVERAKQSLSNLFDIYNSDTIQVCIPYINKDMITKIIQ